MEECSEVCLMFGKFNRSSIPYGLSNGLLNLSILLIPFMKHICIGDAMATCDGLDVRGKHHGRPVSVE